MSFFPLSRNRENPSHTKHRNELQLAKYKEVLNGYRKSMEEYAQRLSYMDNRSNDGHAYIVQTAMLTQLKSQGEEILLLLDEIKNNDNNWTQEHGEEVLNQGKEALDQMEGLMATIIETNYKLGELDKGLTNKLNSFHYQVREEKDLIGEIDRKVDKAFKGNRRLMWTLITLQLMGFCALAFIILYLLGFIYF